MATINSGITTSFGNTPQAQADLFTNMGLTEDSLRTFYLDVMGNDLGGQAKTLYSLDSGTETTIAAEQSALLTNDQIGAVNYSANGAHIWITTDGKVGYDATTLPAAFQDRLQ